MALLQALFPFLASKTGKGFHGNLENTVLQNPVSQPLSTCTAQRCPLPMSLNLLIFWGLFVTVAHLLQIIYNFPVLLGRMHEFIQGTDTVPMCCKLPPTPMLPTLVFMVTSKLRFTGENYVDPSRAGKARINEGPGADERVPRGRPCKASQG